ncbi:hypothetical protein B0H10DRAFT_2216971 [Mycena sp. CBHHK59/15]|nr:hypothetical protein B0H10DRAFT_2216971 [Mycena sp. CBHHK59/15]
MSTRAQPMPSIRLIAPTPSASAYTDPDASSYNNSSLSISITHAPAKKKSVLGLFASSSSTAAAATQSGGRAADFSDIVRRVGGPNASMTGRGWEVSVDHDAEGGEGEGMVLVRKRAVHARGRVDGVFGDVTNGGREKEKEGGKEKWWNLTRGRKDTKEKDKEGKVLALCAAGSVTPAPADAYRAPPPTPTLEQMQMHLPGEPDCTLEMMDVPSVRGRDLAHLQTQTHQFPQSQPQRRFNSLGATSALTPAPQAQPDYQRSLSAGSAQLLSGGASHPPSKPDYQRTLSAATHVNPTRNNTPTSTIRNNTHLLVGAAQPYAQLTREEHYTPPVRSASAMAFASSTEYARGDTAEYKPSFPRSASTGSGQVLRGAPPRTATPTLAPSRAGTPTLLVPPGAASTSNSGQGSIALRAMRSVRSMARLATWGPDDKDKEGNNQEKENKGKGKENLEGTVRVKKKVKAKEEKVKEAKEAKEKEKREKKEKKSKEVKRVPKSSGSSFEVGALGTSPVQRKRSILGLGLPSALTIGRSGGKASTASSVGDPAFVAAPAQSATVNPNRLSADIARRASTNSSLRPLSVLSSGSSSGSRVSSGSSVRWAEEVVDRVRGGKEKERAEKKEKKESERREKESRRTSEGRRRTPLSDVFPGMSASRRSSTSQRLSATTDGHGHGDDEEDYEILTATPVKRPRVRPVSEDLLLGKGKIRPRGIHEDTAADSVLTLLDAATNDLAQLITHLDLEATPGTPSPAKGLIVPRKEWEDSPTGKSKTLRPIMGSVSSLRPYAQLRAPTNAHADMIGQQIAPWPTINMSPPRASPPAPSEATFKRMHRRTMTPSPEPEPAPVFQPLRLRPSRIRPPITVVTGGATPSPPALSDERGDARAPSSLTFGSRSSSGSAEDAEERHHAQGLPPVFKRGHARNPSSLLPDVPSPRSSGESAHGMPLGREAKRVLGMGGTMGGSDASAYKVQELDASDPDSDIPDELQVLLTASRGQSPVDDTLSFRPPVQDAPLPSPGLPPSLPLPCPVSPSVAQQLELPVFNVQLIDDDAHNGDIDEGAILSEEDTKMSFDFTGELKKLNESGASDRRSFVEQLENAFKTPAKIDLRNLLCVDVPPPMPSIPVDFKQTVTSDSSTSSSDQSSSVYSVPQSVSRLVDIQQPTMMMSSDGDTSGGMDPYSASRIVDIKEPTLLPGSDSLGSSDDSLGPPLNLRNGPSDGQLNVGFKFGGVPPPAEKKSKKPLTLSDIIPPPSHVRTQSLSSLMEADDSVLKSIFAHAADISRPRVNSDSSAKGFARDNSRDSIIGMHSRTHSRSHSRTHSRRRSRPASGISFTGLDSFDEVRRGFEFHNNRPAFYPPPVVNRRAPHARQDSLFSIASISSYGHVTNPGVNDPFDYGLPMPSLRERPSSEDLSVSMSINVDDTFSFLGRDPRRKRVESDASSFYFKVPTQPAARGHRRRDSNMSVSSQGPPVSFYNYNRSYGNHRRDENDTSTSGSSLAHTYAAFGANGGRAAWAKHRQDSSIDSVMSDFSVARLGRPGVGDKMFDTAVDHGMPLRAISASPPESRSGLRNRSSFDSIIDEEHRSSMEDSLFEKTGHRSSMSSDSVFGYDDHNPPNGHLLPPNQFRPLSMLSMYSVHSPMKEDDTMISMLGGGHVRRRSIGSLFEASPCVRVEKRKHTMFQEDDEGPNKARIVTKASIASTSSSKFGDERMIKATQGLLVRHSLEESCLIAAGEDMSVSLRPAPVFSRPSPNSRSRSSTLTTSSSGADTPPLSSNEGSSMSDGSQSSIDMSHVNLMLSNATHPMSSTARDRARASRSSVYETIQEEMASPSPSSPGSRKTSSPTACQGVFIVEPDVGSVDLTNYASGWDDERGIIALRKYYALRHEAEDTVTESRRMWSDTPFSVYALQTFQPPKHPAGMQALLEHSVRNYGPLPSELGPRRVRSRTQSRASPYPRPSQTASPELQTQRPSPAVLHHTFSSNAALQAVERENAWGLAPNARPRVASAARRTALGWAKRSTKASTDLKENSITAGQGSFMMTPGESLRISRPRPRGRPTPARPGAATPRIQVAV